MLQVICMAEVVGCPALRKVPSPDVGSTELESYHGALHDSHLGTTSLLVKSSSHLGRKVLQSNTTRLGGLRGPGSFLTLQSSAKSLVIRD